MGSFAAAFEGRLSTGKQRAAAMIFARDAMLTFRTWSAILAGVMLAGCETAGTVSQVTAEQQRLHTEQTSNVASLSTVIQRNPKDANALNLRGAAYGQMGDYEKAIADFNAAIAINPQFVQAYSNRALIWAKAKRNDRAFADYNEAIKIKPDYAAAYVGRGSLYKAQNNLPQALADYSRAIELRADDPVAYYNRGLVQQAMNEHRRAVDDFNMALGYKGDAPEPHYARGISLLELRDYKKAYDDFLLVAEARNHHEAWTYTGKAAEGMGSKQDAARAYKRALQLNPSYKPAAEGLRRLGPAQA